MNNITHVTASVFFLIQLKNVTQFLNSATKPFASLFPDLESRVAKMLGMDSAMFVLSGTMGNILAVMAHCQRRGAEIFVGSKTHLFLYEQANMAQVRIYS